MDEPEGFGPHHGEDERQYHERMRELQRECREDLKRFERESRQFYERVWPNLWKSL